MFINPPPPKVPPMPEVRSIQHSLKNVKDALERAMNCTHVDQMTDALISIDYFYNIARERHILIINAMAKEQAGINIPEPFVRAAGDPPKDT